MHHGGMGEDGRIPVYEESAEVHWNTIPSDKNSHCPTSVNIKYRGVR